MDCISKNKCQIRKRRRRRSTIGDMANLKGIHLTTKDCYETRDRNDDSSYLMSKTSSNLISRQHDLIKHRNLVKNAPLLDDSSNVGCEKTKLIQSEDTEIYRMISKSCNRLLSSSAIRASRTLCLLAFIFTIYSSSHHKLINCQRLPSNQEAQATSAQQLPPSLLQTNPSAANQGLGAGRQFLPDGLSAESRADQQATPQSPLVVKPGQAAAFDHLVNLLNNYANQQQGLGPNQNSNNNRPPRPLPLPLNGRGTQPGAPTAIGPQQQQQQPLMQVSTPVNPYNQQFSNNNNNNRRIAFPNQVGTQNQQLFVSSSPPTPYLTLNRISQLAANSQNQNRVQQQFNGQNQPNLQPINTIPLGSINNQQTNNGRANPLANRLMPPPRGMPPQRSQQSQINQMNQQVPNGGLQRIPTPQPSTPLPMNIPQQQQQNQQQGASLKPMTGFAPSGPPPSLAANNAMVVVQSPTNQQTPTATIKPQETVSRLEERPPTDGPNSTESTVGSSEATGENNDNNRETTPSSPTSSSTTTTSKSPEPTVTSLDLDKAANDERPDVSWNPVETNNNRSWGAASEQPLKNRVNLVPSPDIVTVPPGYNPDNPNHNQPQNYDISVSAQMGTPAQRPQVQPVVEESGGNGNSSNPGIMSSPTSRQSTLSTEASAVNEDPLNPSSTTAPSIAPTAVTTIIWSPPSETLLTIPPSTGLAQPTRASEMRPPPILNTRIRDNSLNDEPQPPTNSNNLDAGVVYGKAQTRDSKPPPPPVNPSPVAANIESSVPSAGRPFIQPVQIENQVRPFSAGAQSQQQQQALLKSNHHGQTSTAPFRPSRPLNGQSPMNVGSGFTITASGNQTIPIGDIQDYVAAQPPLLVPTNPSGSSSQASGSFQVGDQDHNEPTISAHGGQDPANFDLNASEVRAGPEQPMVKALNSSSDAVAPSPGSSSPAPPRIRRPTFKPKPAVPPIRIDSCIVDDDSSCDQSHNERCVTEYGISSCHCKPGYARLSQLRGYCSPVSALQLSMKIDRLSDDRRLVFNHTLDNSNTEEYQYLEFEAIQALASAFQQTALAKQFMGARVNKFFERKGKVWVNMSVNFDLNNVTKTDKIQSLAAQELLKVTQSRQRPLGDSTIMLDGTKEAVSRLTDINECASRDLNDCSKFATCTNEFGGFQCQCSPGYDDKYKADDKSKHGRVCLGCSASYCSNRGECSISEGQKQCKCRQNFIGPRCDYDTEIVAVVIGGTIIAIMIVLITCWCFYLFNRRWSRKEQKMDAMSATSGLTYNYVNTASTNSLMSPTRMIGGLHRSGGHQVGAMAANYGQRFGSAIVNGTRGGGGGGGGGSGQQYAADQQAIIGSTSSGSSAASQPIGCNPYTSGGYQQYEDAGLLIAPASTGSSEQTSPSSNSYRGIMGAANSTMLSQMAGNAYTLSGHHHHHMHPQQHHMHHMHTNGKPHPQLTQFHPAADYRTLNASGAMHCVPPVAGAYESRWRTLQQDHSKQSALVGYYLSPDMLVGQQQANMQQLYASPQRELCIDTGGQNGNKSRKQQGRGGSSGQTLRSRSQSHLSANPRNSMYHNNTDFHDNERPM